MERRLAVAQRCEGSRQPHRITPAQRHAPPLRKAHVDGPGGHRPLLIPQVQPQVRARVRVCGDWAQAGARADVDDKRPPPRGGRPREYDVKYRGLGEVTPPPPSNAPPPRAGGGLCYGMYAQEAISTKRRKKIGSY